MLTSPRPSGAGAPRTRLASAVPVFVPLVAHVVATRDARSLGFVLLELAVVAAYAVGREAERDTVRLAMGIGLVAGAALGWTLGFDGYATHHLGRGGSALALGLGTMAAARLLSSAPEGGYGPTLALSLVSLACVGRMRWGLAFLPFVALAIVSSGWAIAALDARRAPAAMLTRRAKLAVIRSLVAAALVGGLVAWAWPRAQAWTERAVVSRLAKRRFASHARSGFVGRVELGDAGPLEPSYDVVMRLRGPHVDYLRGSVLDGVFGDGAFRVSAAEREVEVPAGRPRGARAVEVEKLVPSAHLFAPRGAGVATPSGRARVDALGAISVAGQPARERHWIGLDAPDPAPPGEPTAADSFVPTTLRAKLAPLALELSAREERPELIVSAIAKRLESGYRYSLSRGDVGNEAPIVDFLTVHREGHCEYFAVSLAVLARLRGVPARVVTGYRVGEHNALGGFDVVREADAHAWVEAHWDGAWHVVDPTPASAIASGRYHESESFRALVDAWDAGPFAAYLEGDAWIPPLVVLLIAAAVGVVVRRELRVRAERLASRRPALPSLSEPSAAYLRVAASLASRGLVRGPSETIEAFARREAVRHVPGASEWLGRYAEHRYGGVGDDAELERAADAIAESVAAGR